MKGQRAPEGRRKPLIVSTHNPLVTPADFLVMDERNGQLKPYLVFDEGPTPGERVRVRIRGNTVVGYQDYVFDSASNSVRIEAADEVILEKLQTVVEEDQRGRGWKKSNPGPSTLTITTRPDYAEVTIVSNIGSAASVVTVFKLGFDGHNAINTIEARVEGDKARGKALGISRRAWIALEGLPIDVSDRQIAPKSPGSVDADDRPSELRYGQLKVKWHGPGSVPFGQQSASKRSLDLRSSSTGIIDPGQTIGVMSVGATTSSSTVTITAPGAFELVFDAAVGGGIARYYDLAQDPGRAQNLVFAQNNLFDHRLLVAGEWYYTSIAGQVELVSQDTVMAVVRQTGTFTRGASSLDGTTYEITYTIWNSGQIGIGVHTSSTTGVAIEREDRELQVNASASWIAGDQFRTITASNFQDDFSDYLVFSSTGGPFLDPVLVQNTDWPDADLVFFQTLSGGKRIAWRNTNTTMWGAGSSQDSTYLLLVGNDEFNAYDLPASTVADYRSPQITTRIGSTNGFNPPAAAYEIQSAGNEAAFTLGGAVARHQPRFVISNWSSETWRLSLAGADLTEGVDVVSATDLQQGTVSIQWLGTQDVGATSEFRIYVPGGGGPIAVITSLTPPDEIEITDEGGTFVIPYIQTSTTLELAAEATGVPPGGGIEFLVDGVSTLDLAAPYTQSVAASPGDHQVEAYVVDGSGTRLTNPEAHVVRPRIGIGVLYTTIGDSITAGNFGHVSETAVRSCEQSPSASEDCRNYFQHSASGGVWYRGYQVRANDCLTDATGSAHFLVNDGYGGITTQGIINRMSVYTSRIQALGITRVLLQAGTNDANRQRPISADVWRGNIESIIGSLVATGVTPSNIYLAYVPYTKGNNNIGVIRRAAIESYNALIPDIAASTGISVGPDFFSYFQSHQNQMADALHPNQVGYDAMGGLWTEAISGSAICRPT